MFKHPNVVKDAKDVKGGKNVKHVVKGAQISLKDVVKDVKDQMS